MGHEDRAEDVLGVEEGDCTGAGNSYEAGAVYEARVYEDEKYVIVISIYRI